MRRLETNKMRRVKFSFLSYIFITIQFRLRRLRVNPSHSALERIKTKPRAKFKLDSAASWYVHYCLHLYDQ